MIVAKKNTWLTRQDIYDRLGIEKNTFIKLVEPNLKISVLSPYNKLYSLDSLEKFIESKIILN